MGSGLKKPPSRARKKKSPAQQAQWEVAQKQRHIKDKENVPPFAPLTTAGASSKKRTLLGQNDTTTVGTKDSEAETWKSVAADRERRLRNERRKFRRLLTKQDELKEKNSALQKSNADLGGAFQAQILEMQKLKEETERVSSRSNEALKAQRQKLIESQKAIRALKMCCVRAARTNRRVKEELKQMKSPNLFRLTRFGAYTPQARALARLLVQSGCSQAKVGVVLQQLGKLLGIPIRRSMSRRTVGRSILEVGVACKMQSAHEIHGSKSLTISGDSTSHRHLNRESKCIAIPTPDYLKSSLNSSKQPTHQIRLFGIDTTVDHSSETSKRSWLAKVDEYFSVFNASPLAKRIGVKLELSDFAEKLAGMNGDHATTEKCTANSMAEWKKEEGIRTLGKRSLEDIAPPELIALLLKWNQKKIEDVGGIEVWNALAEDERARRDLATADGLIREVGEAAFNKLTDIQKRQVTSFLWVGCCMHKEQNSFKGGNTGLMAGWEELGLTPPILLANKHNAALLQKILNPASAPRNSLSDIELAALEKSARGGAKAASIAGALFNNKDDKKGYGDTYRNFFEINFGKFTPFPDTNNTHFGSHGEAAIELIKNRCGYRDFLVDVKDKKQRPAWTNLEKNLVMALDDIPTLTELCILGLYMLAVTFPYMRIVRTPGVNGLNLGPLHVQVCEHVQRLIDDPSILLDPDASYLVATLDGSPWQDNEGLQAIQNMIPSLPDIRALLIKFLLGALATWIRFSSEYAPDGLIDNATEEEREAAWMPPTNDANEGALGALRRYLREKPRTTMHQYNALAMARQNDTEAWMAQYLSDEDHAYLMRQARLDDASGLEAKRKAAQVEFDRNVAEMAREKAEARQRRDEETQRHLSMVVLIKSTAEIDERSFTVAMIDAQLDKLRQGDKEIPLKTHLKNKAAKKEALIAAFKRHQIRAQDNLRAHTVEPNPGIVSGAPRRRPGEDTDSDSDIDL